VSSFPGPGNDTLRVKLNDDSDCTYGTLRKIAERFGTTDLRLSWCGEKRWSEHTGEPAEAWLEILGAKAGQP